jgi:glycosyltransferase involved in cell wall biosynthesis
VIGRFWKLFGKKYLFDHHDLSPEMYEAKFGEGGFLHKALLWLERMTFTTADVCITTNESHKRLAVERGGMDPDDVYVVRSGPDLARFSVYEPDPKWRSGAEHAIAYLGDISDQDGVDLLVQAMAVLKDRGRDDIHCVVIGGGSAWEAVKHLAAAEGVADRMTFTGTVSDEDLCRILSSVDAGVDPVPKNNWSDKSTMNKIVEYMYFGLPVVAFDLTEARFSALDAGRFAEPNNIDALATTITDVLDDDVARKAMSEYGAKRLREELAWEHSIPPLVAAYERIL